MLELPLGQFIPLLLKLTSNLEMIHYCLQLFLSMSEFGPIIAQCFANSLVLYFKFSEAKAINWATKVLTDHNINNNKAIVIQESDAKSCIDALIKPSVSDL